MSCAFCLRMSPGALHGRRDDVDAEEQGLAQGGGVLLGATGPAPEQFHLDQVEYVGVRVAQDDGLLNGHVIVQQPCLAGDFQYGGAGLDKLRGDDVVDVL